MPLEPATFVSDLVPTNPPGGDPKSQGDDHLRLIKQVLQNTFPALVGAAAWLTSTSPTLPTGSVIQSFDTSFSQDDWVELNGGTIGNVGSGADIENALYEALFNMLRAFAPNSGTENFGAGDTVVVPDMTDSFGIGRGANALGTTGGSADAVLPQHTHTDTFVGGAATAEYQMVSTPSGTPQSGLRGVSDGPFTTTGNVQNSSGGGVLSHTHPVSGSIDPAGVDPTGGNLPPFVSLIWLAKV